MLTLFIFVASALLCGVYGCSDPGTLSHGSRVPPESGGSTPLPADTVIRFSCDKGYKLQGPPKIICTAEGQWLPTQRPTCIVEDPCSLNPCLNGATCVDSTTSPTGYHCHCPPIYYGDLCQQKMDCALPPDTQVPNSHYTVSGQESDSPGWYLPGATLTYQCDVGYALGGGSTVRHCLEGQWIGEIPHCDFIERPLMCVDPGTPDNAHRCCQNVFNPGVRLSFYCEEGYEISGVDERTCRADGSWSGEQPVCNKVTPAPTPDSNIFNTETLTVVMATTGCILGILVVTVVLTSRQCRVRTHNMSRSYPSVLEARLARLHSDSDTTPFLAVTDNINVVLPSYDEAVALNRNPQPPPFEGTAEPVAEGEDGRTSMQGRPLPPLPPPRNTPSSSTSRPSSRSRRSGRRRTSNRSQATSSSPSCDGDVPPIDISMPLQEPGRDATEEEAMEIIHRVVGNDLYAEVAARSADRTDASPNCNNNCVDNEDRSQ